MIDNPTQLKAKVRNVSHGDNDIAKAYIRIFFMEYALKLYGMPELFASVPRDAIIMVCFNERPGSVIEVNTILKEHKFQALRTSGMQE